LGKRDGLLNNLIRAVEGIAVFCLIAMVSMVFFNAFTRYVFNYGLNQTEELSRFLFIWLTFLGTIVAYHRKEHVTIPLLLELLPGKAHAIVQGVTRVIVTCMFGFLFYCAWIYTTVTMGYKSSGVGITFGLVVMVLPFMSLCIVLIDFFDLANFIFRHVRRKKLA
jgi:TRAP-type C4-dicarboxylate transport system permease small subunit